MDPQRRVSSAYVVVSRAFCDAYIYGDQFLVFQHGLSQRFVLADIQVSIPRDGRGNLFQA